MKTSPQLLTPLNLRGVQVANRAWVAPMLQHAVRYGDGMPTDWHLVHYGSFALGGFGLIITEPTAIAPAGRVTPADTGLWSDLQVEPWRRIVNFVHSIRLPLAGRDDAPATDEFAKLTHPPARLPAGRNNSPVRICLQLNHAGRKAELPSEAPAAPSPSANVATAAPTTSTATPPAAVWHTLAPSPVAFPGLPTPEALSRSGILRIISDFSSAARRAERAGFDAIEINAADGYLIHQFLSPLTNKRTDSYGGMYSNRVRLLREIITALRISWHGPLLVRIPGSDLAVGGWSTSDAVSLAVLLRTGGADLVTVSSGGNTLAEPPNTPGYALPFSRQIRQFSGIPIAAGGAISAPLDAEHALREGAVDAVLVDQQALKDPHWPLHAAAELSVAAASTGLEH
ncbi:MAG: NADH:flavin oxidoreductase/NADH oxidase [Propionibacteriaceae bacterium]|jgi:2,4-dienoyl-CoA reductase-like NADH-dependent reductase (Old Yellow Enzyme family)|nr:NADH:flavin oxidoreductase/NADH oxidase [Propionibacteriaceae bacterium]